MDLQLRGKRALITGSTAGIGFAVAAGLAAEGASIIVNGRGAERVGAAVERLRSTAGTGTEDVLGVTADLSTADGAAGLVAQVPDAIPLNLEQTYTGFRLARRRKSLFHGRRLLCTCP